MNLPLQSRTGAVGKPWLGGCVMLLTASASHGLNFNIGDVDASFDSNISIGASWRIDDIDTQNVTAGNFPGGEAQSSTNDDGDLNFENDKTFSKIIKGVHDLSLSYDNFGAFTRFKYWYDKELKDESRPFGHAPNEYTPGLKLNDDGFSDLSSFSGFEVLDAFLYGSFYLGDHPLEARIGKQVVSWGESTFISNGINVINPVDVSAFRRPGAEVKEGLLPVNMVYFNLGVTESLSLEAFYQLEWEKTQLDPCGTYFSTSDVVADGCEVLTLGTTAPDGVLLGANSYVRRIGDEEPDDSGQYGISLRYYAQELNDTEFGFYFINYHSRLPLLGVQLDLAAPTPNPFEYYIEYPEDIRLYGISFNTNVGDYAFSGEINYKEDLPNQINGTEVIAGLLSTVGAAASNTYTSRISANELTAGYDRIDVTQAQFTLLRAFNRVLGASRLVMVGEVGFTHVMDDLEAHPYGRSTNFGAGEPGDDGFTTENSWGYRLRGSLDYANVFAGVNMTPSLAFSHDVEGYSPTGGAFNEGSKSVGLGLSADYQNTYKASVSYTRYFGGDFNVVNDRDFVAASLGVAF